MLHFIALLLKLLAQGRQKGLQRFVRRDDACVSLSRV
jgi:hypothetical protein